MFLILIKETGRAHGSARSIEPFNIVECLELCSDLLEGFGGHSMAAGLSLLEENLEAFEESVNIAAAEIMPQGLPEPAVEVEAILNLNEITKDMAESILTLEPYGQGNPEPLFATESVVVQSMQKIGVDGAHLKLIVSGVNTDSFGCIAFGFGEYANKIAIGSKIDICYNIRLNSFNGNESIQLHINSIK